MKFYGDPATVNALISNALNIAVNKRAKSTCPHASNTLGRRCLINDWPSLKILNFKDVNDSRAATIFATKSFSPFSDHFSS